MKLQARIEAFTQLGHYLKNDIFKEKAAELHLAEVLNPCLPKKTLKMP